MATKEPVIIKKYANRRLYNTASSTYVTLETLAEMVRDDIEFIVYDAKSGEDLTRGVLTQIIVEQEGKGVNLLPISFLRQIISLYGDNMQWFVPKYLEDAMKHFATSQQQLQDNFQKTISNTPFGPLFQQMQSQVQAQMQKQGFAPQQTNIAQSVQQGMQQGAQMGAQVFEQMMKFFSPFNAVGNNDKEREETLNALKQKIAAMERGEG